MHVWMTMALALFCAHRVPPSSTPPRVARPRYHPWQAPGATGLRSRPTTLRAPRSGSPRRPRFAWPARAWRRQAWSQWASSKATLSQDWYTCLHSPLASCPLSSANFRFFRSWRFSGSSSKPRASELTSFCSPPAWSGKFFTHGKEEPDEALSAKQGRRLELLMARPHYAPRSLGHCWLALPGSEARLPARQAGKPLGLPWGALAEVPVRLRSSGLKVTQPAKVPAQICHGFATIECQLKARHQRRRNKAHLHSKKQVVGKSFNKPSAICGRRACRCICGVLGKGDCAGVGDCTEVQGTCVANNGALRPRKA